MNYLSYKHLYILEDTEEVVYLGYRLKLTKSEYKILKALIIKPRKIISAEQIAELGELNCNKENIVYHISRINSKAKALGDRVLIKNIAKKGYFFNEEM